MYDYKLLILLNWWLNLNKYYVDKNKYWLKKIFRTFFFCEYLKTLKNIKNYTYNILFNVLSTKCLHFIN
jgi:hypothetical protein